MSSFLGRKKPFTISSEVNLSVDVVFPHFLVDVSLLELFGQELRKVKEQFRFRIIEKETLCSLQGAAFELEPCFGIVLFFFLESMVSSRRVNQSPSFDKRKTGLRKESKITIKKNKTKQRLSS